jgi:hypothetical protein
MSAELCSGSGLLGYPEGLAIGAVGKSVTASSGNLLGCMVDLLVAWWVFWLHGGSQILSLGSAPVELGAELPASSKKCSNS